MDPVVVVDALFRFAFNTPIDEQINATLGHDDLHPDYRAEWRERFRTSLLEAWGRMDHKSQARYVQAAMERFLGEAQELRARAEAFLP